ISLEKDVKAAEQELARLGKEAEAKSAELASSNSSALDRLRSFGVESISENVQEVLNPLEGRVAEWRKRSELKAYAAKRTDALEIESKELAATLAESRESSKSRSQNASKIKSELETLEKGRFDLFADKNTDDEEKRLEALVSDADKAAKLADKTLDNARDILNDSKIRIDALKKKTSDRVEELAKLAESFSVACASAKFADENAFLAARVERVEREKLAGIAKSLDLKVAETATKRKELKTRLENERKRALTEVPVGELTTELLEGESKQKELGERVGGLNERLVANETAKKSLASRESELRNRKKECVKWDALHSLIGSGDGKKFRNFAQGLTFEVMVSHANKQLAEMTDRYLLIRDEKQPLELNVIDSYQAGEIRSTKNLSGGEGFIVSLSLALGLSNMASRKVRIDSLFLDEGFGTLDEEALETALEALGGLQQTGKLIGIISHVPALRERITTRLELTPVSGGKSSIAGPGVARLE
ncbi:MAG: hypothetical protein KAG97_11670, partial [Victivallales bacterium]|nr:hypothetical protein [Victivallales bacterium]